MHLMSEALQMDTILPISRIWFELLVKKFKIAINKNLPVFHAYVTNR